VVVHRLKNVQSKLDEVLQDGCPIAVREAEDKELLHNNTIYLAPSNYHLLIERDKRISLSVSEPINFSRPSIDVTFYSVAEVYGKNTTGIILTGANDDGTKGLQFIEQKGGTCIVQNLEESQVEVMPRSALLFTPTAKELTLNEISDFINEQF
jgi:two-component system chemotaxis response regulator CheB